MAKKRVLKIEILGDARSGQQAMEKIRGEVDKTESHLGGFASRAGGLLKGGAVAVGAAVVAGVAVGFSEALEKESIFDKMNADLGASGADAEANAKIAGDLYAGAWGDSLGDVADAVASTQKNLADLIPPDSFEQVTSRALDFAKVLDEDVGGVSKTVGQLLRTGMVDSAEEAFDLLAAGQAQGLNRADDLLDTLNEYAPSFSRLGIDGPQALALISDGLDAGAFNADKIGDAFNEFSIRAIDGSTATSEALATLGLDADTVAQTIAEGGPAANAATSEILAALKNVDDQVAQDAAGVALFGSMWEDLGAEAILGLDTMNDGLAGSEGAAAQLSDTLNNNLGTRLESLKRKGLQGLADVAERWVIPAIDKMIDVGERVAAVWGEQGFSGVMSMLGDSIVDAWPGVRSALGNMLSSLGTWVADTAPVIARQLATWGQAFVEWIVPLIPPFLRKIGQFLGAAFDWIVEDGAELAATKLWEFGQAFLEWVVPLIPPLLTELIKIGLAIDKWIIFDAAPKIAGKLLEWAGKFGAWVGQATLDMLAKLPGLLTDLGIWIVTDAAPKLAGKLLSWAGEFAAWVGQATLDLLEKIPDLLTDLATWIYVDAPPVIAEKLIAWTEKFTGWAGELPGKIVEQLAGLGEKLWEAFKVAWDYLVEQFEKLNPINIADKILNPLGWIPDLFGGGSNPVTDAPYPGGVVPGRDGGSGGRLGRMHSGGRFHTEAPGGQGYALLRDGEDVSPGRIVADDAGHLTEINVYVDGRILGQSLEDVSRVSALDIRLVK